MYRQSYMLPLRHLPHFLDPNLPLSHTDPTSVPSCCCQLPPFRLAESQKGEGREIGRENTNEGLSPELPVHAEKLLCFSPLPIQDVALGLLGNAGREEG